MHRGVKLVPSVAISLAAGGIGSLATTPNIPRWYTALEKPFFTPPNGVFGPVWTLLYILMGISLYLIWTHSSKQPKRTAYVLFGVQLGLNILWSVVFFGLHQPWLALGVIFALLAAITPSARRAKITPSARVIFALLAAILLTLQAFYKHSQPAALLLIPYVAWVSFASALNLGIALLNYWSPLMT